MSHIEAATVERRELSGFRHTGDHPFWKYLKQTVHPENGDSEIALIIDARIDGEASEIVFIFSPNWMVIFCSSLANPRHIMVILLIFCIWIWNGDDVISNLVTIIGLITKIIP